VDGALGHTAVIEDENAQIIVNEDGAFIPRALFGRIATMLLRWASAFPLFSPWDSLI
jgi:hypothetical protein